MTTPGGAPHPRTHPPQQQQQRRQFKVVLLGEGAVGKTSLVLRLVQGRFESGAAAPASTLQASYVTHRLSLADGRRVQLDIWDTAGQERFHALGPIYYRDAHGALLVYDVVDAHSYAQAQQWARELRHMLGHSVALLLVANKVDLLEEAGAVAGDSGGTGGPARQVGGYRRAVPLCSAVEFAKTVDAKHFQVSAKTGLGVDQAFTALCRKMLCKAELDSDGAPHSASSDPLSVNRLILCSEDSAPPSRSFCCH